MGQVLQEESADNEVGEPEMLEFIAHKLIVISLMACAASAVVGWSIIEALIWAFRGVFA